LQKEQEMDEGVVNPELKELRKQIIERYTLHLAMLKDQGPKSLYMFNKWVLEAEKGDDQFVKLGAFHRELCNFVQDKQHKKKLILIPRSHLKTKLVSIGYATQKIIKNPQIRILIYSATWQMAVDIHQAIQKNLKGAKKLIEIWGDFSKDAPV